GCEIGRVESAAMGRPVCAHEPGSVDGEAYGELLDRDVMDHLVVGALQESRIDGRKWPVALCREPCGKGDRMLLGDADVEGTVRKRLAEQVEAGARGHGSGDGDNLIVLARLLYQGFGEDLGVARCVGRRLGLRTGNHVEPGYAVILVGGRLRRRIALALLRDDVNENRTFAVVAHVPQDRNKVRKVVPVDRPDVVEAQFLEQRAARNISARMFYGARDGAVGT